MVAAHLSHLLKDALLLGQCAIGVDHRLAARANDIFSFRIGIRIAPRPEDSGACCPESPLFGHAVAGEFLFERGDGKTGGVCRPLGRKSALGQGEAGRITFVEKALRNVRRGKHESDRNHDGAIAPFGRGFVKSPSR